MAPTFTVWAHSPTTLYRVNMVDNAALEAAWTFVFREANGTTVANQQMVDIAINSAGEMYGVSWNPTMTGSGTHQLYRVAIPQVVGMGTAVSTRIGTLDYFYNALSFAPPGMVRPEEVLLGLDNEGTFSSSFLDIISTSDASTVTTLGSLGGGYKSSGDVLAIQDLGLFATVKDADDKNFLARLSPSGTATILGSGIGFTQVWGLAYWDGTLLGVTFDGQILGINPVTGAGTLRRTYDVQLYGAAVAPNVPLMVP